MSRIISTEQALAAIGPYSQAVVSGGLVFTSGQIPLDPRTGTLVGSTVEEQTEQAIRNLQAVLKAAGSGTDRVVKTTCFLQNMSDFAAFNSVYARYFPGRPARSCVEAGALPRGALVEIEAIAEIEQG
ncbi:MAG: RidA family protein [Lachnospiraceae bacterium]|nr:RidA family protein [Lachnospiraceae bacterium]